MKQLKDFLCRIPPVKQLRAARKVKKAQKELIEWERAGKPSPPPHIVKQKNLIAIARAYNLTVLVETGTFYGDMVDAMKNVFNHIYSIELSPNLFEKARKRFKDQKNVEIIHGDSGKELEKIIPRLNNPTLFWLDGHYSGGETAMGETETPIFEELSVILDYQERKHVIIIDDARLFGTDPGYPDMDELKKFIRSKKYHVDITLIDDSIQITPKI